MTKMRFKLLYLLFLGLLLSVSTGDSVAAGAPRKVALLPFAMHAQQDMSFLRDGIFDMLTTRLARPGQVVVLARGPVEAAVAAVAASGPINAATAREIGVRLQADFVLFGSLTVLGNSASIDAKMVDVSGQKPTMTFFKQSPDLGGVITQINRIAEDINTKLFGRAPAAPRAAAAPQPAAPAAQSGIYANPEKLLKQGGFVSENEPAAGGSPFIRARPQGASGPEFWKSLNFKLLFNGLALGDVDGDHKLETVIITPHRLMVYRNEKQRFLKIAATDPERDKYFIAVDAADINGNGRAEIFVTALNALKTGLESFVLEYDGGKFAKILADDHRYFRVVDTAVRGKILLGQHHRSGQPFSRVIEELTWKGAGYLPTRTLSLPLPVNVLGITLSDVLGKGQETVVAFDERDRLRLLAPGGKPIWKSSDHFGGSTLYSLARKSERHEVTTPLYYPMRILSRSGTAGGKDALIVVKNEEVAGSKLEKFRNFVKAYFESLSWNGLGLTPNWKTRKISGFIRDFALGDFDNDGKLEIVAAVVIKEGRIMLSTPKSTVIAYKLGK